MNASSTAKYSLWRKIKEWLFGKPSSPWLEYNEENDPILATRNSPDPDEPPVQLQSIPWLQAFNNALTDATASFIRDYVEPLHNDDPTIGFSIRAIDAAVQDNQPGLRTIAEMPPETRNRITHVRCLKARGASEQLEFDKFFGLNVVSPDTLIEGYLVRTLVASEGSRINITFRFTGEYVTLKARATPSETTTPPEKPANAPVATSPSGPGLERHTRLNLGGRHPEPGLGRRGTPLNLPVTPAKKPLFTVTILENGGERRIPVMEDGFPVGLGTEPTGNTAIVLHPQRLAAPGVESFISGQHLEITEYDRSTQMVYLKNTGRNGTWQGGMALPERFTLNPASSKLLSLGGPEGQGTAQIRIEAA